MPLYMSASTGFLVAVGSAGQHGLAGSCACYQQRHVLLTASHCISEAAHEVYVVLPGDGEARRVHQIVRHPTADLALLVAERREPESMAKQVFLGVDETLDEGGDFMAFGYPVEGADAPVGRLFKGHFQRYMSYTDSAGRTYLAGELNTPAPAGLSGGPVVRPHTPELLTGVVTTNVESYVVLDSVEEVERNGSILRVHNRRVVTYGLAALLTSKGAWLDESMADVSG